MAGRTHNITDNDLPLFQSLALSVQRDREPILDHLANERKLDASFLGLQDLLLEQLIVSVIKSKLLELKPFDLFISLLFGCTIIRALEQVVERSGELSRVSIGADDLAK